MRSKLPLLALLASLVAAPLAAQSPWSASLSAGYTNSNGYHHFWDDGSVGAIRGAVWRRIGSRLDLGVEGGAHFFGTARSSFRCDGGPECGGTSIVSTSERRSRAWTADLALRWRMGGAAVRPHVVVGLGVGKRSDVERVVRTENGATTDYTFPTNTGLLPLTALGLGLEFGPPGGRFAVTTGVRGDFAYDAYDGTPAIARMVTATVGVTVR